MAIYHPLTISGVFCDFFGLQTLVPFHGFVRVKHPVSHCCTEAELLSIDAGLRMEGIPAMKLWDTVKDKLHPPLLPRPTLEATASLFIKLGSSNIMIHQETLITYFQARDYSVCERHHSYTKIAKLFRKNNRVSQRARTHLVEMDRSHDRINLDPMIQIKCATQQSNLADIVAKGSSTRDGWAQLTTLVNIGCESLIFHHE